MREIEIKFEMKSLASFRKKLKTAGAKLITPRHFEDNILLDDKKDSLKSRDCILRLRKAVKNTLTFKDSIEIWRQHQNTHHKSRREYEVEVDNFDEAKTILEICGFKVIQRYQKYRDVWALAGTEIFLDEYPFINVVEIEGTEKEIDRAVVKLGLTQEEVKDHVSVWEKFTKARLKKSGMLFK